MPVFGWFSLIAGIFVCAFIAYAKALNSFRRNVAVFYLQINLRMNGD